jgi:CMP-N-acetylneuraminic acid synthetase
MFNSNKILAVIPARGGSKGVPRKNIRDLGGKPLIAWTIEAAKKSKYLDRIILSSEDEEIITVAQSYGCEVPFVRPLELAQDDTPGIDVVLHAINQCPGFTHVMLLQPTSPFRSHNDIDAIVEDFFANDFKCSVSVTNTDKHPYWMFKMNENKTLVPFFEGDTPATRQSLPPAYVLNGALYLADIKYLSESKSFLTSQTTAFVMSNENSLDIDTEIDFEISNYLITRKNL